MRQEKYITKPLAEQVVCQQSVKKEQVMDTIISSKKGIAYVKGQGVLMADARSALDFLMRVRYETGCDKIILQKENVAENFFDLRTGFAGEILQKCVNYHFRLGIVGDFTHVKSRALQGFIYESNQGGCCYFVESIQHAEQKLS